MTNILKAIEHKDDSKACISTSEVITIAIVTAKFFGGNYRPWYKHQNLDLITKKD